MTKLGHTTLSIYLFFQEDYEARGPASVLQGYAAPHVEGVPGRGHHIHDLRLLHGVLQQGRHIFIEYFSKVGSFMEYFSKVGSFIEYFSKVGSFIEYFSMISSFMEYFSKVGSFMKYLSKVGIFMEYFSNVGSFME